MDGNTVISTLDVTKRDQIFACSKLKTVIASEASPNLIGLLLGHIIDMLAKPMLCYSIYQDAAIFLQKKQAQIYTAVITGDLVSEEVITVSLEYLHLLMAMKAATLMEIKTVMKYQLTEKESTCSPTRKMVISL